MLPIVIDKSSTFLKVGKKIDTSSLFQPIKDSILTSLEWHDAFSALVAGDRADIYPVLNTAGTLRDKTMSDR